ncbi:MAG: type II secretion system protein [Victivallales bacterium]
MKRIFTIAEARSVFLLHRIKTRNFTLIELLIVISIIAILASMLLPALNAARAKAKDASCRSTGKGLGSASLLYANDFDGFVPPTGGIGVDYTNSRSYPWPGKLAPYLGLTVGANWLFPSENKLYKPFICDADTRKPNYNNKLTWGGKLSYGININIAGRTEKPFQNIRFSSIRNASSKYLFMDATDHRITYDTGHVRFAWIHGGGHFLNTAYADGHIGSLSYKVRLTGTDDETKRNWKPDL